MKTTTFALLTLLATTAFAQTVTPLPPTLTITGSGSVKAPPDRVSFTVGVATVRPTVAEAFTQTTAASNRVIAALKARGVRAAEIQTSDFSVYTPTENDERPGAAKKPQYGVRSDVTVTREDPKSVSELIQAAIDAGANVLDGVAFFVADPTALRDRAIARAFEDARGRAEKLAVLAGRTLGPVQAMQVNGASTAFGRFNSNNVVTEAITVTAEAPAIETGMSAITASVTVTFELR